MTNYEILAASLEDRWFGIGPSPLRHSIASSSDLQNSNPENVPKTLHASPSAPNLRQRSTLKPTGHLRRKPTTGDLIATEIPPRGHVRRASTSSIDLNINGGTVNAHIMGQAPLKGTAGVAQPLPPPVGVGRPPRPEAPSRASARSLFKAQNTKDYAERRKAWRARLEATMAAPRLYTATVPVPTSARSAGGSRGPSVQSTPSGSPKPPQSPIGKMADDAAAATKDGQHPNQHPAVPAVWAGHSSDQPPRDFSALDDDALRRFLQQAGSSPPLSPGATGPLSIAAMNHEELVATARSSRAAWEVERIVVGCSLPEQILRVQKSDCTDLVMLKAAWKRLALSVHPDRCSAEGASVAMAIAKDAFDMLTWRAEQYQAAAAFTAQNDGSKAHTAGPAAASSTMIATAGVGKTAAGTHSPSKTLAEGVGPDAEKDNMAKLLRPLSAPAETALAGGSQQPLKVRVKLKVKKAETAKPNDEPKV
jgi:hypothetical protein